MTAFGGASKLLVAAGAINGLILPITLSIVLIAGNKKEIAGKDYHHSRFLTIAGVIIIAFTLYAGIIPISNSFSMFS